MKIVLLLFLVASTYSVHAASKGIMKPMNKNEQGPDGLPIIFWTMDEEDIAKLKNLITAGYNLEVQGYHGATPALSAAIIDQWNIVKILVDNNAKINIFDRRGFTLAWLAQNAKLANGSKYERAKDEIKALLAKEGLMNKIYEPKDVREMQKNGDWPPSDWPR